MMFDRMEEEWFFTFLCSSRYGSLSEFDINQSCGDSCNHHRRLSGKYSHMDVVVEISVPEIRCCKSPVGWTLTLFRIVQRIPSSLVPPL